MVIILLGEMEEMVFHHQFQVQLLIMQEVEEEEMAYLVVLEVWEVELMVRGQMPELLILVEVVVEMLMFLAVWEALEVLVL